jgi:hypothetical protein
VKTTKEDSLNWGWRPHISQQECRIVHQRNHNLEGETTRRSALDALGLTGIESEEAENFKSIFYCLQMERHGVNAFAIVMNGQTDGVRACIKRMLQMVNQLFGDAGLWDNVCIVLTKCSFLSASDAGIKGGELKTDTINPLYPGRLTRSSYPHKFS